MLHRQTSISAVAADLDLQPARGRTVVVYPAGGVCESAGSVAPGGVTSTIVLAPGHSFQVNDIIMRNLDSTRIAIVTALLSAGDIQVGGDFPTDAGDIIVNLKADTASVNAGFNGSNIVIYRTPLTTSQISQARVSVDDGGEYGYWHDGAVTLWEVILSPAGSPEEIVLDVHTAEVSGPTTSTDNAVVRFDGASGRLIQNSGIVVDDTNNVTGIANLTASGNSTIAGNETVGGTLGVTGAVTASSSATIGSTLGVTGVVTTTTHVNVGGNIRRSVTAGITASTTQTQGQGPLTADINEVSTCANANDTVTLPTAIAGLRVTIINNGAQTLRIFPASGDNLGAGVDTATTLVAGSNVSYVAYNATNWEVD